MRQPYAIDFCLKSVVYRVVVHNDMTHATDMPCHILVTPQCVTRTVYCSLLFFIATNVLIPPNSNWSVCYKKAWWCFYVMYYVQYLHPFEVALNILTSKYIWSLSLMLRLLKEMWTDCRVLARDFPFYKFPKNLPYQ